MLVGFLDAITLDQALESRLTILAEVHLHDGSWQGHELKIGYDRDHQLLGEGDMNVERCLGQLEATEFKGLIILELQVQEGLDYHDLIRSKRPNLSIS